MAAVLAMDLRLGMVILGDEGELLRVEGRELRQPTTVWLMIALHLRDLETGAVRRIGRRADALVELAMLPERELECLYRTDSGCVLFDPVSFEQYEVPQWVGFVLPEGPRPGQRLAAGFWRGWPVTLTEPDLTSE
jgi:translation elongation factor P/translation initiation factor 5A